MELNNQINSISVSSSTPDYYIGDYIIDNTTINPNIFVTTTSNPYYPNTFSPNLQDFVNPLIELEKFLSEYDCPDFKKSFEVFLKNNPNATPEELFIAAMKIGFAIAKLRNNDKKIEASYNSNNAINSTSNNYSGILIPSSWTTGAGMCITYDTNGHSKYLAIY